MKLVTLIVPTYNGAKFLPDFLKSVLRQTYKNIQFILINDGSTDNTDEIIDEYKSLLDTKLNEFIYIKKKNGGAASAINNGLKYVKGEYLVWADVDDILDKDNIFKKLNFLERNPEYGLVLANAYSINYETKEKIELLSIPKENREDNIFERLFLIGIPCYPGVFMVRTALLFDKIKDKSIYYNSEVGQNWQLLLPVAYGNKCGYIDDVLYYYTVRKDSHSHNTNIDREIKRTYCQEEVLNNTLYFLENDQFKGIQQKIKEKYICIRLNLYFKKKDRFHFSNEYQLAKKEKIEVPWKLKIKRLLLIFKA